MKPCLPRINTNIILLKLKKKQIIYDDSVCCGIILKCNKITVASVFSWSCNQIHAHSQICTACWPNPTILNTTFIQNIYIKINNSKRHRLLTRIHTYLSIYSH